MIAGRGQARRALGEIGAQRLRSRVAQRNIALLLPFAANQDGFVGPVNVFEIQAGQLGVADAAAVEQFQNGRVARGPACGIVGDGIDHAVHLLDGRHAGKMSGQSRRGHERGCILL